MKPQQNEKVHLQRTLSCRRSAVGLVVVLVFAAGCSQSTPVQDAEAVESSVVSLPRISRSQGQASSSVAQGNSLPEMPELEGSIFSSQPIGQVTTSELPAEIVELPRNKARKACFEAIFDLRMSPRNSLTVSNACIVEKQECEKDSSSNHSVIPIYHYDAGMCEVLSEYYDLEVAWKELPQICFNELNILLEFTGSDCFRKIEDMCAYRMDDGAGGRMPFELFYRYVYEIRRGFCSLYLPVYSYRQISDNLSTNDWRMLRILRYFNAVYFDVLSVLAIELPPNSAQTIKYMTNDNLSSLLEAADICSNAEQAPIDYKCASALWNACHNLRSVVGDNQQPDSELSSAIAYLCSATYVAELAELAAIIFASFKNDYEQGNFNGVGKFIAEEVSKRKAYFKVDNTGIFISADLAENLSDSTLAVLQSLGESLGQLILPLLPDDETAN